MRVDHRAPNALRAIALQRDYTKYAAGSVLVAFGDTKVLCTATIEPSVPPWLAGKGSGWVTAEYAMLPGSSTSRIGRNHYQKGRAMEISRLIGRSLRCAVDLAALGERQITVDCDVLQADGGTRTAAITGAFVALADACAKLEADGAIPRTPLLGECAAVSVGIVDGEPLLDLCYAEDVRAEVDLNVVMRGDGRYIEVQGCAEGEAFPREELNAMLDLAEAGCRQLFTLQREVLGA